MRGTVRGDVTVKKSKTINKNRELPESQDFHFLRRQGLEHIGTLASGMWTDYNVHDPGISILEVLCYAITDLGYRTGFKIEDILARLPGETIKDFYTAAEILPCNPVTILDFRKLIIDREGVQNGWLHNIHGTKPPETPDPTFYFKCDGDNKSYDIKVREEGTAGFREKVLNGLYNVSLQLEEDDEFGDLNATVLGWEIKHDDSKSTPVKAVFPRIEVEFPAWDDYPMAGILQDDLPAGVEFDNYQDIDGEISFDLTFELSGGGTIPIPGIKLLISPFSGTVVEESDIEDTFKDTGSNSFAQFFLKRLKKILTIIHDVYCALHRHRNLCEDYVKFSIVRMQEIVLCADIEVKPEADLEEVLAKIYFEIDRFLAPPVRFYSLKEMIDNEKPGEEIFEGIVMNHGFIDQEELARSDLKSEIHVSDFYRIIMALEEVISVKSLLVTNYIDGEAQTQGEKWCLKLGGPFHLNLRTDKSKVVFYKDLLPFYADKNQVEKLILNLKAENSKPKLNLIEKDLLIPEGQYKELSRYYSIQNDFPLVYGTGQEGLPATADGKRKAQAKQLKAFLMFFDQLLANYLAQLEDVRNQLSVGSDITIDRTYAVQPLYKTSDRKDREDFPQVANLFKDFADSLPEGTDLDDLKSFQTQWDIFTDDLNNGYLEKLRSITEREEQFQERRNRFLDHLIARFSEAFTDYAVLMFDLAGKKKGAEKLIEDKEDFLARYPEISSQRGKAFQYKCYESETDTDWQESNVSGLKKRLCKLLGIDMETRRQLGYTETDILDNLNGFSLTGTVPDLGFELNIEGNAVLQSTGTYNTEVEAVTAVRSVIETAADVDNYIIRQEGEDIFKIDVKGPGGDILAAHKDSFVSDEIAREQIRGIVDFIGEKYFREGMHLVEHILLRPLKSQAVTVPDIEQGYFPESQCQPRDDCPCPVIDHYSFRITIVLPYWPLRFRNMNFRAHVEKTIRMETPAHILPKICWVSLDDMNRFEVVYKEWLAAASQWEPDRDDLTAKIKALIKILNNLTTLYPKGVLHDCRTTKDDDAIILNMTQLGTFEEDES